MQRTLFLFNHRRTANPITPCVVITDATFLDPDNRVAGEQWERQLQRLVLGRVDRWLASTAIPLSRGPWSSWRPVACETRVRGSASLLGPIVPFLCPCNKSLW